MEDILNYEKKTKNTFIDIYFVKRLSNNNQNLILYEGHSYIMI